MVATMIHEMTGKKHARKNHATGLRPLRLAERATAAAMRM